MDLGRCYRTLGRAAYNLFTVSTSLLAPSHPLVRRPFISLDTAAAVALVQYSVTPLIACSSSVPVLSAGPSILLLLAQAAPCLWICYVPDGFDWPILFCHVSFHFMHICLQFTKLKCIGLSPHLLSLLLGTEGSCSFSSLHSGLAHTYVSSLRLRYSFHYLTTYK